MSLTSWRKLEIPPQPINLPEGDKQLNYNKTQIIGFSKKYATFGDNKQLSGMLNTSLIKDC